MKLYCHPASITSRPVRLLIAERGLDVDEEIVDLFSGAHHQEPYVSINPSRMVPLLEDGDFRLTESGAILRYLAGKYDMAEYPTDLKKRAKVDEIMDWFGTNFYRDWGYGLAYPQLFPHHKRQSDEAQAKTLEWAREKSAFWLQVLNENWLGDGRPYLTGNEITIADYYGSSLLAVGRAIHQDFSKYPNAEKWLANVQKLEHWAPVSEALEGFAASTEGQTFVTV